MAKRLNTGKGMATQGELGNDMPDGNARDEHFDTPGSAAGDSTQGNVTEGKTDPLTGESSGPGATRSGGGNADTTIMPPKR